MRWLELKIPPLLLCAVIVVLTVVAAEFVPASTHPLPGQGLAAAVLLPAGLAIMFAGALHFRRRRTTLDPRDPAKTARIVSDGIYRVSRNPMYLGMALALAGVALWFASLPGLTLTALFCVWINELQIKPEERILLDRFGDEYRDYMGRVRRWL